MMTSFSHHKLAIKSCDSVVHVGHFDICLHMLYTDFLRHVMQDIGNVFPCLLDILILGCV